VKGKGKHLVPGMLLVLFMPDVTLADPLRTTRLSEIISVLEKGVVCDGVTDDAPALRSLFKSVSNSTIVFPSGKNCLLGTTVAPGYPASDNAAVLISRQANFHIIATGTTFTTSNAIPLSQAILIDRGTHWTWDGGVFVGSRVGLAPLQENVGIGLFNNVDFRVSGVEFKWGYGGAGAPFCGDWNVDGTINDIVMNGVGIGFDTAFSKNLIINNIHATGADTNGASGTGQVGTKFFSNIYDTPSASVNYTGYMFTDTDGVTLKNSDFSNFETGVALASGAHFRFIHNNSHDNPGQNSAKGIGYYIYYNNGGVATSIGHPVKDVVIDGGIIANNGGAIPGYGVVVVASTIRNSDVIDGILIQNSIFDNNKATAIGADSAVGINHFVVRMNTYKGVNQITTLDSNTVKILKTTAGK
jgi:hypothetical protein